MSFEADPLENDAMVWIADDFLGQRIAAVGIGVDVANAERFGVDVLEGGEEIALFFVYECLAVRDEELHVADLGAVDCGVVDLVEHAMGAGKPDAA